MVFKYLILTDQGPFFKRGKHYDLTSYDHFVSTVTLLVFSYSQAGFSQDCFIKTDINGILLPYFFSSPE